MADIGRGLKRSNDSAPTADGDSVEYMPLKMRRQLQQERIAEAARLSELASASRSGPVPPPAASSSATETSSSSTATPSTSSHDTDRNKTLLEIQAEMRRERGGRDITDEERLREQEAQLLAHLSKERAPMLGRKQVAGVGEVFTRSMETGWRPRSYLANKPPSAHAATREKFNITLEGDAASGEGVPPPATKFTDLRLPRAFLAALRAKGIAAPTPIQVQGLPVVLSGRDMIGIAFTGSGKTLVFVLPMVVLALQAEADAPLRRGEGPVGLVVVPSRELAVQIHEVAQHFASFVNAASGAGPLPNGAEAAGLLPPPAKAPEAGAVTVSASGNGNNLTYPTIGAISCVLATGGINMGEQWSALPQGCGHHVMVGTPGRLGDLLGKGKVRMDRCLLLAMDEADRLVDLGFEEEMRGIFDAFPSQRQTVLFSATMPKKIQEFALTALVDPVVVNVGRAGRANLDVIQEVEYVKEDAKLFYMLECLQKTPPPVIVFAGNQSSVDSVHEFLLLKGVDAVAVHGGKDQEERTRAIKEFKEGRKDVLVATDVASKGLDFPDIKHVINYDMPKEIEDYIHRIGRTGRCGKTGVATSFVNRDCPEVFLLDLKHLLKEARQRIPPVLQALEDPADFVGADGDNARVCEYCDGRGHRVIECPKLKSRSKALKNTYGYDMVEDQG